MNNSSDDLKREQAIKQFDAGQYLKQLRGEKSLAKVCKLLKITPAHLSEIERGRMPSDSLISALANVYEVNEDDLFLLWGKIPTLTKRELLNRCSLQDMLTDITHNHDLTDTEKDELYGKLYEMYRNFMENKLSKEMP
ncbi:helix-turn-helix transcriptional regulator [Desulfosporosinus sp. FKA]|uniref:helix-turn-helix domain-containing protein n=1 Tax=Desulfosporosinus sp. FKA TaxID=1969834 RepID=UPI000B49C42A|nr:helix-turn-helix transcriptional regulator [Desulfosporosinus sp. FKA]